MCFSHIGLILASIGTIALAVSVKFLDKHLLSARSEEDKREAKRFVKDAQDGTYWEPTVVQVNKYLFYGGLSAIVVGTLMQW